MFNKNKKENDRKQGNSKDSIAKRSAEIIKKVSQVEIKTSRIVNNHISGSYHSAFRGTGIEFDEVREYVIGDDTRSMDWKVSARYGRPYIKRFREERELTVMLMVDFSASTNFGFETTKKDLIVELSALLAFSAIENNDKVGMIIFTDEVEKYIAPKKGRNHILTIIRELLGYTPKSKNTNIASTLNFLKKINKRHSVAFLITDFSANLPEKEITFTNKKHDLIVCLVKDSFETIMPRVKATAIFRDLENDDTVYVDLSKKNIIEEYRKEQENLENSNIKMLTRYHIDSMVLDIRENYVKDIVKFFKKREHKFRVVR